MKNKHLRNPAAGLASLILSDEGNNDGQPSHEKTVIADECGDTLWDDVLKQDESNLSVDSNETDGQPANHQIKVKHPE